MDDRTPKNNNLPIIIERIYLRAEDALQGGHELMGLATGRVFRRPKVTVCTMTPMVIDPVDLIEKKKSYKSLKFSNRKKRKWF